MHPNYNFCCPNDEKSYFCKYGIVHVCNMLKRMEMLRLKNAWCLGAGHKAITSNLKVYK